MWLVIAGLLSVGFGVFALLGLLAVVNELFCDTSSDTNFSGAGTTGRQGVGGRDSARRCMVTR